MNQRTIFLGTFCANVIDAVPAAHIDVYRDKHSVTLGVSLTMGTRRQISWRVSLVEIDSYVDPVGAATFRAQLTVNEILVG